MTKTELRNLIRTRKSRLTPELLTDAEVRLAHAVQALTAYQDARTILCYASLQDEVPTLRLLQQMTEEGRRVVLPTVVSDTDLQLRLYTGSGDLEIRGRYHIPEPTGPLFEDYHSIDLALIPGMAFDRVGNRLGRGKGYYDRLLAHPAFRSLPKVGVCFDFQCVESVPADPHDRPMDSLIVVPMQNL